MTSRGQVVGRRGIWMLWEVSEYGDVVVVGKGESGCVNFSVQASNHRFHTASHSQVNETETAGPITGGLILGQCILVGCARSRAQWSCVKSHGSGVIRGGAGREKRVRGNAEAKHRDVDRHESI